MMSHDKRLNLTFAALLLGVGLAAPVAFADDWDSARDKLRRAEEELGKDTRQYNEARSKRDRKGMENEWNEIQKDRAEVARRRSELDGMRRTYDVDRGWRQYDERYRDHSWDRDHDHDWDRNRGRGWAWGHHKDDRDDWRELHKDKAELRKDQRQLEDAWRRGDRRGVEQERREIWQDHREIESDRNRIGR